VIAGVVVVDLRHDRPLLTGQRVLDVRFPFALVPFALGGAAVIPGGFGTGKPMTERALAKHAAADVVVYIGCNSSYRLDPWFDEHVAPNWSQLRGWALGLLGQHAPARPAQSSQGSRCTSQKRWSSLAAPSSFAV